LIVARSQPDCRAAAHPLARHLYEYWLWKRDRRGALPGRQDVDPVELGNLLPWIWIATVLKDPIRFQYRLVGTAHVEAIGSDPTGKLMDDAHPGFINSRSRADMVEVVQQGVISYRNDLTEVALVRRQENWRERLALPLARDGTNIDMTLCITIFFGKSVPRWALRACQAR
jgi:hypothetical protein